MRKVLGDLWPFLFNQFVAKSWGLFLLLTTRLCAVDLKKASKNPHILVCNHISHFDPTTIAAFYSRKIDFMTMSELFSTPFLKFLFWSCSAFSVKRGSADMGAIREALRRLKKGCVVGIFPEGGIRSGEKSILEGASCGGGAATIAQMGKVPVQVCMLIGTDQLYCRKNLFRRVPIYFQYGPELKIDETLPHREAREKLSNEIEKTFQKMYLDFVEKFKPEKEVLPCEAKERWERNR